MSTPPVSKTKVKGFEKNDTARLMGAGEDAIGLVVAGADDGVVALDC